MYNTTTRSHIETQPSEVPDAIDWYFKQIGQFRIIKETEEQHRLARRIFRGQLALRALETVQGSELLTSPQNKCITELLADNMAQFLLDNYPTPPKKPEEHAKEVRPFLSAADRYIRWVDSKLTQASQQEVIMTQVKFASQGLESFKEMVEGSLRLVVFIARRYYTLNLSLLDKVSYGNEALMEAVAGFDFRMGNRFSTFAIQRIGWAVWRGIKESDNMVTIPEHAQRTYRHLRWKYGQRVSESGDDGSEGEDPVGLAGLQEMQRIHTLKTPIYLSTPVRIGEDFQELGDLIPSEELDPSEDIIARVYAKDQTNRLLQCLSPRELSMVQKRFGLNSGSRMTLEEIGIQESLTRERIRKIIDKALEKMKDAAENGLPGVDKPDNHQPPGFTLTPRQVQVLQLAVDGLSNQGIAASLDNSATTIKEHMRCIYQAAAGFDGVPKTNFRQVIELATQKGFIQLPEGQEITTRAKAKKKPDTYKDGLTNGIN